MALQFETIPVTPFQQNATILWDDHTRDAVLLDVGGEADLLLAAVAGHQLNLRAVWLTHGHVDHVGGVAALTQKVDVPVLGPHQDDDFWLQQLPDITAAYGFPPSPAFVPTRWLHDGDTVAVGAHEFQVLPIPGHTPGHVVFYSAPNRLLLAGDVLFRGSIGRTDFPRSSHADLVDHIRRNLLTLPENTQVLPGHGPMTSIGHEKRHNPFLRHADGAARS